MVEEAEIGFDGKSFKQFWQRPGTFVILDQGNVREMVWSGKENVMLQDFRATDAGKLCILGPCSHWGFVGKVVVWLYVEKRYCNTTVYLRI